MDSGVTLNSEGAWKRSGDTVFFNFPTYFSNISHAYLIKKGSDTLFPVRSHEVTCFVKD